MACCSPARTGFVGMALLARYLERTERTVYALVRGEDDREAATTHRADAARALRPTASLRQARGHGARRHHAPDLGLGSRARCARGARERGGPRRSLGVLRASLAASRRDQRGRHAPDARACRALPGARRCGASVHLDGVRRGRAQRLLQRGRPRRRPGLPQRLRAARSSRPRRSSRRGARSCPSRSCARVSSSASAAAAGRSRSTASTGRCGVRAGGYAALPARREAPVDIVPVDYVADATFALSADAARPRASRSTSPLARTRAASASSLDLASLVLRATRAAPARPVGSTDGSCTPRSPRSCATSGMRRALRRSKLFFPYFTAGARYDDRRARVALRGHAIAQTPLRTYFDRLLGFALASGWGAVR